MKKQDDNFYDIIVVGAGPAGLAFVKSVSGLGLRICVVDPAKAKSLAKPTYDGREIALTHSSYSALCDFGVIDAMGQGAVSLIKKAHVINGDEPYALRFDHREAGEETLGYMASNQNIRAGSYAAAKACKDVTWMLGRKAADLTLQGKDGFAHLTLDDGTALSARLIVAADGRFSALRRAAGIKTDMLDWGRTCLVGKMRHDGAHHDTAYECFHYDRTLAVLPLNDGYVSVVITLPSEEARHVLNMAPEDFAADIEARFERRVGAMHYDQALQPYPLVCSYASSFVEDRFALLGDAAVGMHPVTAHGYNLGLRGAMTLAEQVKLMVQTGGDVGGSMALARYNRTHNRICKPLYLGTNTVVKLFSDTRRVAKLARKSMLRLGNVFAPAKRLIMSQLTETHRL